MYIYNVQYITTGGDYTYNNFINSWCQSLARWKGGLVTKSRLQYIHLYGMKTRTKLQKNYLTKYIFFNQHNIIFVGKSYYFKTQS